jgi:hypothetical protein
MKFLLCFFLAAISISAAARPNFFVGDCVKLINPNIRSFDNDWIEFYRPAQFKLVEWLQKLEIEKGVWIETYRVEISYMVDGERGVRSGLNLLSSEIEKVECKFK